MKPSALIYLLTTFSLGGHALATEIPAGSVPGEAVLGSAYRSERQMFAGDKCLNGQEAVGTGKASAAFTFQTSMSESQLAHELGLSVGGRARSGAVKYSGSANFLRNTMSNSLSVSSAWESSYVFPVDKLIATKADLNATGRSLLNHFERWNETCGNEYVNEITRGAQLFFSIRIDFNSKEEKQEFEAKFSVSGPLAGVNGALKNASRKFSRSTKVYVSAYQVGGDVSKLTAIFGNDEQARKGFTECQLGAFEQCAEVINRALDYASNVTTGFPSQIAPNVKPGPAVLAYRTAPYSAIGIYLNNYPGLSDAIKLARQEVSNAFERNFRYAVTANRLLETRNIGERRAAIEVEKEKVDRNIMTILDVSELCFNEPANCPRYKTKNLVLEKIDESVFLPPTFAALCEIENASTQLRATFEKIRRAVDSPAGESCQGLEARVKKVAELNLSGEDRYVDALDLRPLATLRGLERLVLSGAKIDDINPLGDLVNLKFLDLSKNHIVSVEPLSDMMDLVHLNLSRNQIREVRQLSGLLRLQRLYLESNRIEDLSELKFLPQILAVDLRLNPLTPEQIKAFRDRMPPTALIQY